MLTAYKYQGAIVNSAADRANIEDIMRRQTGFTLRKANQLNTIEAINHPDAFMNKVHKIQDDAIVSVSIQVESKLNEYLGIGLPYEIALKKSIDYGTFLYNKELEIMNYTHPGFDTAIGGAGETLRKATQENAAQILGADLTEEELKKYRDLKKRRRATKK